MTDNNDDEELDLGVLPFEKSGDSGSIFIHAGRSALEEFNSPEEDAAWAFLQ